MTSAEIAVRSSDYTGNANLGGGTLGVINVDTRPFEQLAAYTFSYNKTLWDKDQKDMDEKIKELSTIADIHVNDLRGKDKDKIVSDLSNFLNYASEFARKTPKTNEEKLQQQLEWHTKRGALLNNYDSGKSRAISYQAQVNKIKETYTNPAMQDVAIKKLDEVFDATDIGTPIPSSPNYELEQVVVPDPKPQTIDAVGVDKNDNTETQISVFNPAINSKLADATTFGLVQSYIPKTVKDANGKDVPNPAYESLSKSAKDAQEYQATVKSSGKIWSDMAVPLNAALKQKDAKGNYLYFDENGAFNHVKFEEDNASNSTLMTSYNALKSLDNYSRTKYNDASSGIFNDRGISYKLPTNVNPNDFKAGFIPFDKDKDISGSQLVQAGMFSKYGGDAVSKKLTHTGETNDMIKANIQATTIRRGQDLDYKAQMKRLSAEEEKWKATQKGGEVQLNGAMERAKRIYSDMLKIADKNGVITPDKVRLLNTEQLKYLGIEKLVTSDAGSTTSVFTPLSFKDEKGKDVPHAIQLVDGQIRILKNAEKSKNSPSYLGQFDPEKSTNIFNIGTNILNEELKNSGAKELNSYMGVDVTGGTTTTTSGGSTTVSGSTKVTTNSKGLPVFK